MGSTADVDIDPRPTLGGLYSWEFEKGGHELRIRVDGQLILNDAPLVVEAAKEGSGIGFIPGTTTWSKVSPFMKVKPLAVLEQMLVVLVVDEGALHLLGGLVALRHLGAVGNPPQMGGSTDRPLDM